MKNNKTKKLLYKSFDVPLKSEEKARLENAFADDPDLVKERDELLLIRKAAEKENGFSFKPFFPERTLARINSLNIENEGFTGFAASLAISFKKIGLTAIFIFILLLSYNLRSGNNISLNSILGISDKNYEYYAFDPVHKLIWSNMK
jgi:hypothetical protein